MTARPLVLPDPFSGEQNWDEWVCHFENVATVNKWEEDATKLNWLKVRLTGKAQTAFQRFPEATRGSYEEAKKALKDRFEPESRRERYRAEFQVRRRRKEESWSDFGDNLKLLVDRAYPDLDEKARDQLALNHYLGQLADPQIAFSVKQKRPKTLDEAVSSTLEMESYQVPNKQPPVTAGALTLEASEMEEKPSIGAIVQGNSKSNSTTLQEIMNRLEDIEKELRANRSPQFYSGRRRGVGSSSQQGGQEIVCWNCGQPGHIARLCSQTPRGQPRSGSNSSHKKVIYAFHGLSAARFSLPCKINNHSASLILDTGAAVSLISSDLWRAATLGDISQLDSWDGEQLIGVDGSPLSVAGTARVELTLEHKKVFVTMLVVDSLTAEGIIGIDFLKNHKCIIDIPNSRLHFTRWKLDVPLEDQEQTQQLPVSLISTLKIPPLSEMEVMASAKVETVGDVWLLENDLHAGGSVATARAVVQPKGGQMPVRVLNISNDPVTLYKGTRLAKLEKPVFISAIAPEAENAKEEGVRDYQLLSELANTCSAELSAVETERFHQLLEKHRAVFMLPGEKPGRTGLLRHTIDTGHNKPIRQGLRRMSPSQ